MRSPTNPLRSPAYRAIRLGVASLLVLSPLSASSAVLVTATISPGAGIYHYSFSVENTGPDHFVLVSVTDAPLGDPLIDPSLTAPPSFLALYDPGLGIVDFSEDVDFFSAGTVHGAFTFDSLAAPGPAFSSFEALSEIGDLVFGNVDFVVVPEPAESATILGLGLLGGAMVVRRRLRAEAARVK